MSCRVSTPKAIEFRSELEFEQNYITLTKEQSVISKITKLFAKEKILLQHSVLDYKIDLYFPKHKLAVEVDEKGHTDGDEKKENERKKEIKEKLGCEFVRINPNRKDYDEYVEFGEIYNHINRSTKKLTEKLLINTFSIALSKIKSFNKIKSLKVC